MVATYCTPTQVIAQLGIILQDTRYDGSKLPSTNEITEFIEDAEEYIDKHCNTSWKITARLNEYHGYPIKSFYNYIWRRNGYIIQLRNRDVLEFDGAEGDKIEMWQSESWLDLVATGTAGVGQLNNDYFLNPDTGILFLNSNFPVWGEDTIRISYRYRKSATVPKTIRRATILLAAAYLIESNFDYNKLNASNDVGMTNRQKAEAWEKRAHSFLDKEFVFVPIPQR